MTVIPAMQTNIVSNNSILILMSPRRVIDHYKRPLTYNFTHEVTSKVAEALVEKPASMASVRGIMNGLPEINSAIVPSRHGFEVKTSIYSDQWMFVLIVDDDTPAYTLNKLPSRTVYTGICGDEPISQVGLLSATPEQFINPNCQLLITRKMVMNKITTSDVTGHRQSVRTVNDSVVTHYDSRAWDTGDYYSMTPWDVNRAISLDPFSDHVGSMIPAPVGYPQPYVPNITSMIEHADSLKYQGTICTAAELSSPRKQMTDILTAVETGASHLRYNPSIGNFGDGAMLNGFSDGQSLPSYISSALNDYGQATEYRTRGGMVTNFMLMMSVVMSTWSPRVVLMNNQIPSTMEIIPQHVTNLNTIFSSLVCAVVPSYMTNTGLSSVSFSMNTYHNACRVFNVEAAIKCTQEELHRRWNAFEYLVRTDLTPMLITNGGQFDLSVSASINGVIDVVLNFMDFTPLPAGTVYQENAILGGIVSPVIGTPDNILANGIQLSNMIENVGASSVDIY